MFRNRYNGAPKRRLIVAPLIITVAIIAFQYFSSNTYTNPITGKISRVALSTEQESALGVESFNEILSQSRVINSGIDFETIVRVVDRLTQHVDNESKKFKWEVSLVQNNQANAFCLPGGKIVVYTGILPITKTESGLAAVLGHEIAHATSRHGSQRIFQNQIFQTVMNGVNSSLGDMDLTQRRTILGLLGAGVQYGMLLPYGRDHELEADEMGVIYMIQAGYNPNDAIEFWQRMEDNSKKQPPEWMSTHPSHGSRIENIKKIISNVKQIKSENEF